MMLGWHQHEIFSAMVRVRSTAFWKIMVFLLEALVFVLIGLSVPAVLLRSLDPGVAALPLAGAGYAYAGLLAACAATCVVLGHYGGKLVFH